jgi:dynein heavy chain, axonemal
VHLNPLTHVVAGERATEPNCSDFEVIAIMSTMCRLIHGPPPSVWLPGLFAPSAFLAAVLRDWARERHVPVENAVFTIHMLASDPAELNALPAEGVRVHGLWLQGCSWDAASEKLCDAPPHSQYAPAPCVHLVPCDASQRLSPTAGQGHGCLLYRTAERYGTADSARHPSNYVTSVDIPCQVGAEQWKLCGAVLLRERPV